MSATRSGVLNVPSSLQTGRAFGVAVAWASEILAIK